MSRVLLTGAFAVGVFLNGVQAASQAICGFHGRYLNTDDGHTPCDVASILVGGGTKPADSPFPDLDSLGLDHYPVPTSAEADDLRCNYVFYNLVSACSSCQRSTFTWTTWNEWKANCGNLTSPSYIAQKLPGDIPIATWAFIPPAVTGGTWNNSIVYDETLANQPDSYFVKEVIYRTQTCASSTTPAGTIAGATVGGVVGLGVVGVLAFFLFRRKKETESKRRVMVTSDMASIDSISREKSRLSA